MNILFWINKSRCNARGEASIMLRVTHKGNRVNVSTELKIDPKQWDNAKQKVKGSSDLAKEINKLLQTQKSACIGALDELIKEAKPYTSKDIIDAIRGMERKPMGFIELYNMYINQIHARIGVDFSPATVKKYIYTKKNLELFFNRCLKVTDVDVTKVDRKMVASLEQFLRGDMKFQNNYVIKCMEQIRKVFKMGILYEYVSHNPFDMLSFRKTETNKDYLSKSELNQLLNHIPSSNRMQECKDVFLFMCFTGLAHTDAQKATHNDLVIGSDNCNWLTLKRTKTNGLVKVPILPVILDLIVKYHNHSNCTKTGKLMPVPSNQAFNRSLKLLMLEIGINKNICSHSGRYTFASTVLLGNGIRIETAQRLLAHKSIKSTMIYGKLSDATLLDEVNLLRIKLE
ncbi:MAG: site-specific integrase [Fluviicola sp.]|nr:site-specific integrase [Fluviicola sp.]MBP6271341.1 site-specific integrase [Fluviicola sp.]